MMLGTRTRRSASLPECWTCPPQFCMMTEESWTEYGSVAGLWLKDRDDIFLQPPSVSGEAGFRVFRGEIRKEGRKTG